MTRGQLLCFALLLSACSRPPTQLVVAVRSDLEVPQTMTAIVARVRAANAQAGAVANAERRFELVGADAVGLPFSFGIAPIQGDPAIPLILEVEALSSTGAVVVQSRSITGFRVGKTLLLEVLLSRRCQAIRCAMEQTCAAARCVPAEVASASLPEVVPGDELRGDAGALDAAVEDAGRRDAADGGAPDATVADGSMPDAAEPDVGLPDAAPDAGAVDAADPDASAPDAALPDGAPDAGLASDASDASPGLDAIGADAADAAVADATTPDGGVPDVGFADSGLCSGMSQRQPAPTFSAQLSVTLIGWPALSVTTSGHALLLWMEHAPLTDALQIKASSYDGTNWTLPVTIDQQTLPLAAQLTDRQLAVALDENGLGLATWRTPDGAVSAATYSGTAWSPAAHLSGASDSSPLLAMSAGRAVIAWRELGRAQVVHYSVAGGFGQPQSLGNNVVGDTEVAINASGRALLAYYGRPAATGNGIYVLRFDGAAWGPEIREDRSPSESDAPSVQLDDLGHAFGTWRRVEGPGLNSQRARVGSPLAFTSGEVRTDAQTSGVAFSSRVAVDGCGGAIQGLVEVDAGFNLWVNRYRPGLGWQPAGMLDLLQNTVMPAVPAVAMNRHSSAVAAWNIGDQVRASWASSGGPWSPSINVAQAQIGAFVAVVAGMGDNGHPILAWSFNDLQTSRSRLFVNVLEP